MGKGQALGAERTLPVLADCHKPTPLLPFSPILPSFPTSLSFCQSLKYAVPGIKQAVAFCEHACCFPAVSGCVFGFFCPRPPGQALSRNFSQPSPPLFSSGDLGSVLLGKLSLWHKEDHELKPGKNVKSLQWETQKQGMAALMHGKASRAFKSPP